MEHRTTGIILLRILIGLSLMKDFITYYTHRNFIFDNNGIVSYETYQDIVQYYNLQLLNIDFNQPSHVFIFCLVGFLCSLTFTLGLFPRISAILLFFLLFIFKFRNIYLLDGGDNIITALLPFFFFISSKSLCKPYTKIVEKIGIESNYYLKKLTAVAIFGIMILICIVYFFAGLHKLQGEVWLDGTALYYILNTSDFSAYAVNDYITQFPMLVYALTWSTIVFQLLFPIFVWFNSTRKIVLLIGILLHLGILLFMRIDNFSFIMLACYAVFFTDQEYDALQLKTNLYLKI
ncbi:HTTM domain-containing protein [Myroides odoratus]|uniref:Antimicrobial peptide system protein, SdpB family n=1 Tax=Myroides odoratus TaxID=256 RepID=A0A378RK88_MYROD|nr:HTTM domain-containing protein [Myroides odoratus]QQU02385.1 HTTM domain-containing protein [Myroides odoratus]STZ26671.1 antimicrobial peptide system protein, SdpB family [Myroides odoratus]